MPSSLKEELGRRVRTEAIGRVLSGSPVEYLLHAQPELTRTISAISVLVRRHVPLREAKAAIEHLVEHREVAITVPMVEDARLFEKELNELGIHAVQQETTPTTANADRAAE